MGKRSRRYWQSRPSVAYVYGNREFRSVDEVRWAAFFDLVGIPYEYRPRIFEGDGWKPDFALPTYRMLVSVKQSSDPQFTEAGEIWNAAHRRDLEGWDNVGFLNRDPQRRTLSFRRDDQIVLFQGQRLGEFCQTDDRRYGPVFGFEQGGGFGLYFWGGDAYQIAGSSVVVDGDVPPERYPGLYEGAHLFRKLWLEVGRIVFEAMQI